MSAEEQINDYIDKLDKWKAKFFTRLRRLIHEVEPEIVEEWKWSTPVFGYKKMVCALGAFKDHVKINFFEGASLRDPNKLFNAGLEAKKSRSIDYFEGDTIKEKELKELIDEAVALNR